MFRKQPGKKTQAFSAWMDEWRDFKKSETYLHEIQSSDYIEQGICHKITYPRLKTVITGKKPNGSRYSDGKPANLKYFKCDWTPRKPEDYLLSNALCLHIREMIELQHGIEIDNVRNVLILNKADFRKYVMDDAVYGQIENIWVNQNIIFNSDEMERLNALGFKYIPREFFGQELREAAE
jgi:adenine-specific DNA-methyltransferase